MSESERTHTFLRGEIERLEPFDFLAIGPAGKPLHLIEISRAESNELEVRIPGRPKIAPELPITVRDALDRNGFSSEDASDQTKPWVRGVADPDDAVSVLDLVLREAFSEKPDPVLDIFHGSHKAEHEARKKLEMVRERVEKLLTVQLDAPPERDADGDYLLPIDDVQVAVAPRALPNGPVIVRIFAITNVGVAVTPELGIFLARLNFGLMFGRFALDVEHNAIWFDETLLGDQFSDEELRFAIRVVATTADEWDDRMKQMFGGDTYQEMLAKRGREQGPTAKPGQGELPGRGLYL